MLKLKRVELQGFKSFCDRTEMRFHGSGVAAVVGPNGCGKSNLSDAISWVLGEQSAKTLRGARMEDVIFAGTRERKPVGMASVTMTLADPQHPGHTDAAPNGDLAAGPAEAHTNGVNGGHANGVPGKGHAPAKSSPSDITITRRLFRSGESEYLINGRTARLRDIQDIFMGTGLGPESYAIIEQGRIGQILSSKPHDRRGVIEEAAGITKFKTRRRLAEARLESAKQNLARVFDILEEVSRQVNSLKRQAAKAKRYDELKRELTGELRRALGGRYRILEREAARTALDLAAATSNLQTLTATLATSEAEYTTLRDQCYRTEADLTEARRRVAELQVEAERNRGRLDSQAAQIASLDTRLSQGGAELESMDTRAAQLRSELAEAGITLAGIDASIAEARQRLTEKSEQRDRLQAALREKEKALETGRQQVLRLLGEASSLRNQLAQIDEYLAATERDQARARREEETAGAETGRLDALRTELSGKLAARQMQLESVSAQRMHTDEELNARKAEAAGTRRDLEALRAELSRLIARRDSLEGILSHRAYTTESVKRLFTAIERGEAGNWKPAGVLADFVEVTDPRFEKAAEEFLHEELEFVVVKNWDEANAALEFARLGLDGRVTFLVHPEEGESLAIEGVAEPGLGSDSGVVGRLGSVLRFSNGLTSAPVDLLPRLARCFLVDERSHAQQLARQYPDIYLLLPDGVCYHGHAVSGGRKTGSGPLALKRELRDLQGLVIEKERQSGATHTRLEHLEREIAKLAAHVEELRARQHAEERETLALDHEMRKLAEESARINSRLSTARLEMARLERERAQAHERRASCVAAVDTKETARREQELALEQAREELGACQSSVAHASEEHAGLRAELAGFEERHRSESAARNRIHAQCGDAQRGREELAARLETFGIERARLLADNIELDRRRAVLTSELQAVQNVAAELLAAETAQRQQLTTLEESVKTLRTTALEAQEQRAAIELELVKRQAELKYLDETSRKELGTGVDEIAAGSEDTLDDEAIATIEERCQELRAKIDALGPVNPQALEEYEEAQQRYEFLNTQRQDLLDSIRDTEKAIHDIDAESRRRFSEAFEAINANFREMFKTLFGGGVAEMRLTDEANTSDSGIDIVASPPGKKLQNVLLLSGGEKALTAVALLMAIFRYQPSPFCILDEVDAPLDEPNIERLTRLLREMAGQTQFIVITHAKRTMESAQALYGVTMQEPGVSKLVSVKFQAPPPPPQQIPRHELAAV